jgi:membrane fusion protein (multidrug efflux system)
MNDEQKNFNKERTLMRRFILCGLCLVPLFLWGCGSKESVSTEKPPKASSQISEERQVEVMEVFPKAISYTLTAVGSLKTPEHVKISPKKAGIIDKILVREGESVRKGQVLVQLDNIDARLQVERAEARVREAEASLDTNRNTLARYRNLFESKVIAEQTFDDIKLKVKLDEARLALAKTELNMARQNLLDHQIVSPIDGVINLKIASLGEHVNVAPKDEIMTIVQMDPLELEFYIPENWAGRVRPGSRIQFSVRAFSEETSTAVLNFISPTADPATRNVKMKAIAPNPHHRLKPGFFAEVTVPTGSSPNGIAIPESAIMSQEGKLFVFAVREGMAHRREVEPGIRFDGKVEIVKGVQKGEKIVTVGHEQLTEGTKVKIQPK